MSKMGSLRAPTTSSPPSRENAGMSTIIRDVFQASQDSIACHPKLVKKLRNCYDSANDPDKFFDIFIKYLRYPISGVTERTAFIDRTLDFCAKFACCFIENREEKANGEASEKEKNGEGSEDEEEELPLFTYRLFTWLLDHHEANGSDTRLRVCQMINKLLKYMGEEACIDDDLYNKIYDGMLERLKDKVAEIRSQAVTALQRLQDPRDEDCPIIKAYLFHLAHDPNNIVRRMIVRCIGATRVTLPHILERTRDTDEHVRRAAYKFLADKVHIKSLTIGQREGVLQRGQGDRSEAVRHIVEKEMIPAWLRLSGNNIVQLLHHLDVGNSDQDFAVSTKKVQPACVGALQVLFADVAYRDLVANFQYLDENKMIPFEKLTAETALYWRCLVKFMDELPEIDKEDLVETLLPELTSFCDYIRRYVLELEKGDEDMHWEFVAIELIRMTKNFDIGDEVGRRNLVKLVKDLLSSTKTPISFVPHLVEVFARVEENTQSRIDQIAEIISELKDPICDEVEMSPGAVTVGEPGSVMREAGSVFPTPASVQPTPARPEVMSEEERQQKRIEIAKLRVQINVKKDELDVAVGEHDFSAAQLIKIQLDALDEAASALQMQLASSGEAPTPHNPTPATTTNPQGPTPATVLITPATGANVNTGATLDLSDEMQEGQDKPAVVLKCLKLIVSTLQDPKIQHINATLQTLMEEFIVKSVQSEVDYIRKEAINALTCVCLRSIDLSRINLLLLVHAAHIDVMDVRIAAVTALVDLLMKHGLVAFITNTTPEPQNELDNSETASRADSNIESALDSDMAMRGATLTQSELENQGGNSVVAILSKLLDEPDIELRTEVAEGLCKLLMIGAISSPKLLSRLILIWYNPMTESDSKLRHILGTFFPLYCSMSRGHQEALRQAFLPTMKVLFDAPVTSPMSEIDSEDVGMFIIHLTSENCLQSFDKDKKEEATVEDTSNTTVHDELVFPICNEVLSAPDAFQCKVLIKHLSSLQLTPNNYTNLRSIKSLSEQLLGKVKERSCVRQLEKFDKTVQGWLANDPSSACLNIEGEKKRANENEETVSSGGNSGNVTGSPTTDETPRKKKKLFSQTLHGQTLLHPEDVGSMSSAEEGEDAVFTNTSQGVIPSPVVIANKTGSPTARLEGVEPLNASKGEKEKRSEEVKNKVSLSDKEVDEEVTISGNYFNDIVTASPKPRKEKGSLSAADLTGIQDVFQSTQVGSNISVGRTSADEDTEEEDKSENETLVEDKDQSGDEKAVDDSPPNKKKGTKKVAPVTVIPPSDEDEDPVEDIKEAKKKGKKKKASALQVIPLSDEEEEENKEDDMFSDASSVTSVVSVSSRLPTDNVLDDSSTEEDDDSIFAKNESPESKKKKTLGKKAAAKGKKKVEEDNENVEETPIIVNKNLSMRRAGRRGQTNNSQGSESASDRSSTGASPVVRRRKVEDTPVSTTSSRSSRSSRGASPATENKTQPANNARANTSATKSNTSSSKANTSSSKANTSSSKANTSSSKANTSANTSTSSRRSTRKSRTPSQSPTPSSRSTRNSPVPPEPKPTAGQKKKTPSTAKKPDLKDEGVPEEIPKLGRKRASPRTAEPSSPSTTSPATKKKAIVNLNVNGSSKKAQEAVRKGSVRGKKMGSEASNSSDDFVPDTPKTNTSRTSGRKK